MKELILFKIENNHFALELDKIKRIVQATVTTPVAGNADEIEGVFTFEEQILNVVDFRSMIGLLKYTEKYNEMFSTIQSGHIAWVEALIESVEEGVPFTKELNPNGCALGKWLNSFNVYDSKITAILDELFKIHNQFHGEAVNTLNLLKEDKAKAHDYIETVVNPLKEQILAYLDALKEDIDLVVNTLQKFLILDDGEKPFAVRIDEIDDIISIDESSIQFSNETAEDESYVNIEAIFEYKENLVNLIQSIELPKLRR